MPLAVPRRLVATRHPSWRCGLGSRSKPTDAEAPACCRQRRSPVGRRDRRRVPQTPLSGHCCWDTRRGVARCRPDQARAMPDAGSLNSPIEPRCPRCAVSCDDCRVRCSARHLEGQCSATLWYHDRGGTAGSGAGDCGPRDDQRLRRRAVLLRRRGTTRRTRLTQMRWCVNPNGADACWWLMRACPWCRLSWTRT